MAEENAPIELTSESIATDAEFLSSITGVEYSVPKRPDNLSVPLQLSCEWLENNVFVFTMSADGTAVTDVKWKTGRHKALSTFFEQVPQVPSLFDPISVKGKDKLWLRGNCATMRSRCSSWSVGCETYHELVFDDLVSIAAMRYVKVQSTFTHFSCHHRHPLGTTVLSMRNSENKEELTEHQPRVTQILAYNQSYSPFETNRRRVPTHNSLRKMRSDKNKSKSGGKGWFETLNDKQLSDMKASEYMRMPACYRGSIQLLTNEPRATIYVFNFKR